MEKEGGMAWTPSLEALGGHFVLSITIWERNLSSFSAYWPCAPLVFVHHLLLCYRCCSSFRTFCDGKKVVDKSEVWLPVAQ